MICSSLSMYKRGPETEGTCRVNQAVAWASRPSQGSLHLIRVSQIFAITKLFLTPFIEQKSPKLIIYII